MIRRFWGGLFFVLPCFLRAGGIGPVSPPSVMASGEIEFEVSVEVRDVSNLFGVSFVLSFDPNYLQIVSETKGLFLGDDVVFFAQEENGLGRLSVGITQKAGQAGASGTGLLLDVRFLFYRSVFEGRVDLAFTLSEVSAIDAAGSPISLNGWSSMTEVYASSSVEESNRQDHFPMEPMLFQNYPNPFNAETRIGYALPEEAPVSLRVYDALGREVSTLVEGSRSAGEHTIRLDAEALPSGLYHYRLLSGPTVLIKHFLLLK